MRPENASKSTISNSTIKFEFEYITCRRLVNSWTLFDSDFTVIRGQRRFKFSIQYSVELKIIGRPRGSQRWSLVAFADFFSFHRKKRLAQSLITLDIFTHLTCLLFDCSIVPRQAKRKVADNNFGHPEFIDNNGPTCKKCWQINCPWESKMKTLKLLTRTTLMKIPKCNALLVLGLNLTWTGSHLYFSLGFARRTQHSYIKN